MKILVLILLVMITITNQDTDIKGNYFFESDLPNIADKDIEIMYKHNYDIIEFTSTTYKIKFRNEIIILGKIKKTNEIYQLRDSIFIFKNGITRRTSNRNYIEFLKTDSDTIKFKIKNNKDNKEISSGRLIKIK